MPRQHKRTPNGRGKNIFSFSLCRTKSVGPTKSRVIEIKINGPQTTRLTPAGPTGPFIHALTLSCTAEASLRTVYTANPSLHALREFGGVGGWGGGGNGVMR